MAQIIRFSEIQAARERSARQARDRDSLRRAVDLIKRNLHATAVEIVDAPAQAQPQLLDRAEKFIALIRYGMRMLGEDGDDHDSRISLD